MHGLCRAIGAGIPCTINGRTRILHPMRVSDWGMCEQVLLLSRQPAFEFAIQSRLEIGKSIKPALREICKKSNYLSFEDINEFIDSPHGVTLTMWMCFRGAFEYEECELWQQQASVSERSQFLRSRNQISSVDLLSRLDWPVSLETDDKRTNWMSVIRSVCEVSCPGISPNRVGDLTLYQLRGLTCDYKELEGVTTIPRSELQGYLERKQAAEEMELI